MTLRRTVIRALDRPGGRAILSRITTRLAQKATGEDVRVWYDGLWMHRAGRYVFPDSGTFDYHSGSFSTWPRQAEQWLADAQDYWCHVYEPAPGDVIIDVGAGRGEDVLAFSSAVGSGGLVVAVEANPTSFALLERFCALNGLTNVRRVQSAVTDRPGTVQIETGGRWELQSIVSGTKESPTVSVPGITVDGLCEMLNLPRVDFLKMNIEGAERLALEGMKRTIERLPCACIACHDFRAEDGEGEGYRTAGVVAGFLRDHGMTVVRRESDPRPWVRDHIHAYRPG